MSIQRVSTAADGTEGNGDSHLASISADGRFIAFWSNASNLVPNDTNASNLFRKDTVTGEIVGVSFVSAGGAITDDGRWVVFSSRADNLVPGDTNNIEDLFRKDLQTGAIVRVSTAADGSEASGGGIFSSSRASDITPDGRYVVFTSTATNLVAGDTNDRADVFVKDLQTGAIVRVSTAADGSQGNQGSGDYYGTKNAISADGRFVAFVSEASNLVAGDTNGRADLFVKDLQTGTVTRVNTAADGTQSASGIWDGRFDMSADGQWIVFNSSASDLVPGKINYFPDDVFRKNVVTGEIDRVSTAADGSQVNGESTGAAISDDGRWVAFRSDAPHLVPFDGNLRADVFVKDMQTGTVTLVSVSDTGTQPNAGSAYDDKALKISADGRFVVFTSEASNLVADDRNGSDDVFVVEVATVPVHDGTLVIATDADDLVLVGSASPGVTPSTGFSTGKDSLDGLSGDDTLIAGAGDDTLYGGADDDLLRGESGNDRLTGGFGDDTIEGGDGDDFLNGGWGGNDRLHGGGGNDEMWGGGGALDRLDGGDGNDTLRGGSEGDIRWVGTLIGGNGDDSLICSEWKHLLDGGDGNDTLLGSGSLNDTLLGGDGDDSLYGDMGNFTRGGNDRLEGGAGADFLDGDLGDDRLFGGDGNDTLLGDFGNDTMIAGEGDDVLIDQRDWRSPGNDVFVGGLGADTIRNREGDDVFRYERIADSLREAPDAIGRFAGAGVAGGDVIDLSRIDADRLQPGNQAFEFLGEASAFTAAGQVRMVTIGDSTLLLANVDTGLKTAEFAIVLWDGTGVQAADYTADDFIL